MTHRQGFFSLLASVVVVIAASDAHAICPFPICYTYKSSTTIPGSEVTGLSLYGDSFADIIAPSSVQGTTFDTQASTPSNQSFNCTHDGAPALCTYSQPLVCHGFQAGTQCRDGERESLMQCTVAGAGCTGQVQVHFLDGTTPPKFVDIGKDPLIGTDNKLCNTFFPTTNDLSRGVMGKVVQQCVKGAAWSANDQVLRQVVRNDNDTSTPIAFTERSQWLNLQAATCNPDKGLPGGACTNSGIVNIAFQAPSQAACSAANLRCGQKASNGDLGPQPVAQCSFDSVSGQCSCNCSRCDQEGITLVNVGVPPAGNGTPGIGIYTISNEAAGFTAACTVEITGTN